MDIREHLGIDLRSSIDPSVARRILESSSPDVPSIMIEIEAIHCGRTKNDTIYTAKEMRKAVKSWTSPYNKPFIWNHESGGGFFGGAAKPFGRVISAKYTNHPIVAGIAPTKGDEDWGEGAEVVTVKVTDSEAINAIIGECFLTTSIGTSIESASCYVCGANPLVEDCPHDRGRFYENKRGGWLLHGQTRNEISSVNIPSDVRSQITKILQNENYTGSFGMIVPTILEANGIVKESAQFASVMESANCRAFAWDARRAKPILLSESASLPSDKAIAEMIANMEWLSVSKDDSRRLLLQRLPQKTEFDVDLAYEITSSMWSVFSENSASEARKDEVAGFYLQLLNHDRLSEANEELTETIAEYAKDRNLTGTKKNGGTKDSMDISKMSLDELSTQHEGIKTVIAEKSSLATKVEEFEKAKAELEAQVAALTESAKQASETIQTLNAKTEESAKALEEAKKATDEQSKAIEASKAEKDELEKKLKEASENASKDAASHETSLHGLMVDRLMDMRVANGSLAAEKVEEAKGECADKSAEVLKGMLEEAKKSLKKQPVTASSLLEGHVDEPEPKDQFKKLAESLIGN